MDGDDSGDHAGDDSGGDDSGGDDSGDDSSGGDGDDSGDDDGGVDMMLGGGWMNFRENIMRFSCRFF